MLHSVRALSLGDQAKSETSWHPQQRNLEGNTARTTTTFRRRRWQA